MTDLSGKKIAIVVDNYFDEAEFAGPMYALKTAGAEVEIVGAFAGQVQSMQNTEKSNVYHTKKALDAVDFDDYDALVLPGGAINADRLRMNDRLCEWIVDFMKKQRLIAAICHAPWALASAGVIQGRRLTSYYSIQDDLRKAGADWVDEEVVIDGNLITSRQSDDILAFNQALVTKLKAV